MSAANWACSLALSQTGEYKSTLPKNPPEPEHAPIDPATQASYTCNMAPKKTPEARLRDTRDRLEHLDLDELSPDLPTTRLHALSDALIARDIAETRLHDAVHAARRAGHTWRQIATVCGVTHQAAMERFTRKETDDA